MRKVPEIRFRGFTNAWAQRKLEEVSTISSGGTPNRDIQSYWNGKIPWITTAEVNYSLIETTAERISEDGLSKSSAKIMPAGTILMAMYGQGKTRGQVAVLGIDAATNQANANILVNQDVFNYFIYYQLVKGYEAIRLSANEGGQANLSLGLVKDIPISITHPLAEQTAIGNFFRTLDDAIALHKRKLDGLKELKKGYLQLMFPQTGERVPRVRFAGFTGEWEECELGEVADIVGGGTPSTGNGEYWNGHIDWYAPAEIGEQIFLEKSQRKISEMGLRESSARILPAGTVLFTSRAGIGNTTILTKPSTTNQGFQSIVPHEGELESYFIFSRTHELKKYGETVGAGSTFVEVSGKQMARMPILIPNFDEQITIGNFFRNLDEQITAQQNKLEQLKQLKAAYLQKMFV